MNRLIGKREPIQCDFLTIVNKAKAQRIGLELNSRPDRLDLDDKQSKIARDIGVQISINTDAHSMSELNNLQYGIAQARRGWLRPSDVLNTQSSANVKKPCSRIAHTNPREI